MSTDIQNEEKVVTDLKLPKLWKVIFLNDDVTPMELVVKLLTEIFKHDDSSAKDVMLEVHNSGSGVAGMYTYEIAEQKGLEATAIARANGSPLKIVVEEDE